MATLKPEEIRALAFIDVDQTLVEGEDGQFWQGESWLLLTAAFTASIDTHIEIFSRFRALVTELRPLG